jgi:hypothetical protein
MSTTRRALFGGALGVAALTAAPFDAQAETNDTALIAIAGRIHELQAKIVQAEAELDRAYDLFDQGRPPRPEVLRVLSSDHGVPIATAQEFHDHFSVENLRKGLPRWRQELAAKTHPLTTWDRIVPRAEAVVAAYDHWKEATKALEISTGATAADAHWGRLYKRQSRLVTKAIAIPAQSMAGLKAKASIASLWFNDQGDIAGPSRGEEFALAIITDLQNMGGGHG